MKKAGTGKVKVVKDCSMIVAVSVDIEMEIEMEMDRGILYHPGRKDIKPSRLITSAGGKTVSCILWSLITFHARVTTCDLQAIRPSGHRSPQGIRSANAVTNG